MFRSLLVAFVFVFIFLGCSGVEVSLGPDAGGFKENFDFPEDMYWSTETPDAGPVVLPDPFVPSDASPTDVFFVDAGVEKPGDLIDAGCE